MIIKIGYCGKILYYADTMGALPGRNNIMVVLMMVLQII
jgi:hypothetical protein